MIEKVEYDVGLKPDDFSRRELERGGSAEPRARLGVLYRAAGCSDCADCRSARCVLAPRANITRIDNDLTAWFSRDDPVYREYERFRTSSAAPAR